MINQIKSELQRQEKSMDKFSENGARMHATTGQALLDMNFKVASYRGKTNQIMEDFTKAFAEDPELAVKWAFFARDIREGLGERDLFRAAFHQALTLDKRAEKLLGFVSEFGRWDDIFAFYDLCKKDIVKLISEQLKEDMENVEKNKSCSLLAKWMPSVNTSSKLKRNLARDLAKQMNISEKDYRKMLSALRKYIDVIEVKLAGNKWDTINYQTVPSQANLKYRNAFLRHDETRRREFLSKLEKGEVKINASVSFPHDIVHQYFNMTRKDEAIEGMWKALPNYGLENTLVVADGSGSMTMTIPGTNTMALDVANGLAIYCGEHNTGDFKDKFITFSGNPKLVDFSKCNSLFTKLQVCLAHNEVANTNIYKVFKLVLDTAVKNKMSQSEMVKNILVISDMEFDSGTENMSKKLFDQIKDEYIAAGYDVPRCIFWNVNSRTGAIPMTENKLGVALVSGFSVHILKMVLSNKLDPFEVLKDTLMSERYKEITLG